jgi:hypothetical protein
MFSLSVFSSMTNHDKITPVPKKTSWGRMGRKSGSLSYIVFLQQETTNCLFLAYA